MEWRSSCPAQFSKTQYHLHTDKKFRAKIFSSCPVFFNKNIIYIHIEKLGERSTCPAQSSLKKKIYISFAPFKKFRGKKFSPCPVLCNKNIIYILIINLGRGSSHPAQFSVIKISFTHIYYMACVCSQYNACSDWVLLGYYSPIK